jgi:hypothetical protein
MNREVVPLQMTKPVAQRRIRELAADTANVIEGPEIKSRMLKRRITWQEIINVLQMGLITEGPYLDIKGCWRCNLQRFGAGRNLTVVVAISADKLIVITAF